MSNEPLIIVGEFADYKSREYKLEMDCFKQALQFDRNTLYGDLNYGKRNGRQMILGRNHVYRGEVTYKDDVLNGPIILIGADDSLKAEGEYLNEDLVYAKEIKPDVTRSWTKDLVDGYHCEESLLDGKIRVRFNVNESNLASGRGEVIEEGTKREVYFKEGHLKEKKPLWVKILIGVALVSGVVGGIMYLVCRH